MVADLEEFRQSIRKPFRKIMIDIFIAETR